MNNHMLLVTLNDTLGKESLYMTVELSQVELNKMEEIYKRCYYFNISNQL